MDMTLSLELSKEFNETDIFEISALDKPAASITVVSVAPQAALPENWISIPVRQLLTMSPVSGSGNLNRIMRACHIVQWRRESCFCGTCGAKNDYVAVPAHCLCPKCGRMEFPRICPAVIVLITDSENRILLAYNRRYKTKVYSHISGFNEAGESLEETVIREIREEINIEVKDIEYIKSQPWPFSNSLMVGFKARYSSGTIQCDGDEIVDAQWFTKNSLPQLPGEGSLSRDLINCWLDGTSADLTTP
jgi:NAD+ diphosphatase